MQVAGGHKIEAQGTTPVHRQAIRIGERVLDGNTHISGGKLRHDRAVYKFYHGMNDGLGVNVDVNLGRRQTKKPMRLNNFQAFVHQSGGVDGNPAPHLPDGVLQGLLGGQAVKSLPWSLKKWPSGPRQDDTADFPRQPGAQTLVDR